MVHIDESKKTYVILERDDTGRTRQILVSHEKVDILSSSEEYPNRRQAIDFVKKVFLPSGYPDTVSPGVLSYFLNRGTRFIDELQIIFDIKYLMLYKRFVTRWQACSLPGLSLKVTVFSPKKKTTAPLTEADKGFGVGDPSASATQALLVTVVQDVFNRITTIFGAYAFGSSLFPEAKTYRFLADVLNDAAVVVDTLSPLLNSSTLPLRLPGLRVGALCFSASCRALCGIAAGGSKAAITLHFATPVGGVGDVGDLNAKDSSKETVLALCGMLLGTLIVPRLASAWSTYSALFFLISMHLGINYIGVRGLALRSLNRQRVAIAWGSYRSSDNSRVLPPVEIAKKEKILEHPAILRDFETGYITGKCIINSSIRDLRGPLPLPLFELFKDERYLLWYNDQCLRRSGAVQTVRGIPRLVIFFKDGYTQNDQLKAWTHATELCRMSTLEQQDIEKLHRNIDGDDAALMLIRASLEQTRTHFSSFIELLDSMGWNTTDVALLSGLPRTVILGIKSDDFLYGAGIDEKKKR